MKTKITILGFALCSLYLKAQTVADFEIYSLPTNSAFSPSASTSFQSNNAIFEYKWDSSFGYWDSGFSYTNKQDSSTGTFSNLYGVKALQGYSNSAKYVVSQGGGTIKLIAPFDKVEGFYITNTTYAYKVIKNGNGFSRKFGDTTGTFSPSTTIQGTFPDFFKITAKGFKYGSMKTDSAVFFLADYRFANSAQDYVLDTWQWFNTASLGSVDSIKLFIYSSDVGAFGMNTPAYFAFDNFTTSAPNLTGVATIQSTFKLNMFPNPVNNSLCLSGNTDGIEVKIRILDINCKQVYLNTYTSEYVELNLEELRPGVYFVEVNSGNGKSLKRLIKN